MGKYLKMLMVDWLSVLIAFPHNSPINGGNVFSIDANGVEEWRVDKKMQVEGSYSATVQLRSESRDFPCSHLRLDGNLVKFMQGHNVWGSSDIHGLITASLSRILSKLNQSFDINLLSLYVLNGKISRLDITAMYDLENHRQVLAWIRAASDSASMQYRGRGQFSGNTLYWGKHSRRWSLKMYPKGEELKAHRPKQGISDHPQHLKSVTDFADRALRVELVLRGMELERIGLSQVQSWNDSKLEKVYSSYLSGLEFSENMKAISGISDLEKLPPRLRACALAWSDGHDLRLLYPRASWYRYKKQIFECIGLDISLPPPKDCKTTNVIPLFSVLEAKPMCIPSWAYGTHLYFEPPIYSRNFQLVK